MADIERLERRLERERRARKEAERLLEEKSRELYEASLDLRESANTLRAVIDAVPAKINARDANGRYLFMNAYQKEKLGISGKVVNGLTPADIVDEAYQAFVSETDEVVIRTKAPIYDRDEELSDHDGVGRTWLSNKVPVFDDAGELKLIVNVSIDITRRRRAEQERKALESQLRQAQKMESLGTLAGGAAHEFNNMLVPMIGLTELVMEDLPEGSLERTNLEKVLEAGARARNLVKQILTFSREQPREIKENDLAVIVREAIDLIRTTTPSTIGVETDLDEGPLFVFADGTELHQILMNLTSNAAQAMEGNTGSIRISLTEDVVSAERSAALGDLPPGKYAMLTVADTGCGMDPATIQRIFEPFFTTKEVGKGTGLGLAMIHAIVARSEGNIRVESEPGAGTKFEIRLPICPEHVTPGRGASEPELNESVLENA